MRRAFADPKQLACLLRAKILPPRPGIVKFLKFFSVLFLRRNQQLNQSLLYATLGPTSRRFITAPRD
jgi:hypothetical protein